MAFRRKHAHRLRRVSTWSKDLAPQLDALRVGGCDGVYEARSVGRAARAARVRAALCYMCQGDTLAVWKLDRLARSLKQLIETVEAMGEQGIGLRSLTEAIDTTTSGGKLIVYLFAALAEVEREVIRERNARRPAGASCHGHTVAGPPHLKPKGHRRRRGAAARP